VKTIALLSVIVFDRFNQRYRAINLPPEARERFLIALDQILGVSTLLS
jgi:hypothetical protein